MDRSKVLNAEEVAQILRCGLKQARQLMRTLGAVELTLRGDLRLPVEVLDAWMRGERCQSEKGKPKGRALEIPSQQVRVIQPRTKPRTASDMR